ncbi:hypothetical protein JCM10908_003311 [Rhodotorula pacifica]|uniref:uncharacterized protein n=1 Tax=Rhodotorula pacifica TaxID=1495444 RepID=UPI00317BFACE
MSAQDTAPTVDNASRAQNAVGAGTLESKSAPTASSSRISPASLAHEHNTHSVSAEPAAATVPSVHEEESPPAMREAATGTVLSLAASERTNVRQVPAPATGTDEEDGRIRLDVLLLCGARTRLHCSPDEHVGDVKRRIWKDWPADWQGRQSPPDTPEKLGLLYRGRFLSDETTLEAAGVQHPEGIDHVVVHLHIRNLQPLQDKTGTLNISMLRYED